MRREEVILHYGQRVSNSGGAFYSMPNFTSITVCRCIFDISGLAFGSAFVGHNGDK
jgi:hypothetical protein